MMISIKFTQIKEHIKYLLFMHFHFIVQIPSLVVKAVVTRVYSLFYSFVKRSDILFQVNHVFLRRHAKEAILQFESHVT